jgi:hypothetical protein
MQRHVKRLVESSIVEEILCNKCGKSCLKRIGTDVAGLPVCDQYGLIGASVSGGFLSSDGIQDGITYEFDVCEACVDELFKTFSIEPVKSGWPVEYDHDMPES